MADWLNNLRHMPPGLNLNTGDGHARLGVAERAVGKALPRKGVSFSIADFRTMGRCILTPKAFIQVVRR